MSSSSTTCTLLAPSHTDSQTSNMSFSRSPPKQTATMDKEYEFFVTTDEPHQPEGSERGLIRRLVMRNFFETKWSGPEKNTSERNSKEAVRAKPNLKSRFRLPKPGQEIREPKTKPKSKSTERRTSEEVQKKPRSPRPVRKSAEHYLEGCNPNISRPRTRKSSTEEKNGGKARRPNGRMMLRPSPSAHRFDPFDVLPIAGSPQMDILLRLCELCRIQVFTCQVQRVHLRSFYF
jgi:hypothetical protein